MKFLTLLALVIASSVSAKETVFQYDGFYSRLKKSEQATYSHVTLAFLLRQQQSDRVCDIQAAFITTDLLKEPLILANNGELLLPYDQNLNDNKAKIRLEQAADAKDCDLNFRLRNKLPLEKTLSLAELHQMHGQFKALMADMAGLAKYFLPEMPGVSLQFAADVDPTATADYMTCHHNICSLDLSKAPKEGQLEFSQAPDYVVPWIQR